MEPVGTYEDYLQSVRAQESRDRDRFRGWDSHDDKPRYSAEDGHSEPSTVWSSIDPQRFIYAIDHTLQMMVANVMSQSDVDELWEWTEYRPSVASVAEKPRRDRRADVPAKPKRHTYPKQHGQWWNR